MQLDAVASNLNSNDAFILVTPSGSFLWVGVGASDTEKQGAQQLCDILGASASELSEGGESGEETEWTVTSTHHILSHSPFFFFCSFWVELKPIAVNILRAGSVSATKCGLAVKIVL